MYLGIDLTSSQRRPSAYAFLDDTPAIVETGFVGSGHDILALVESHRPHLVAIDAPLSLPRGLCCLEDACNCTADGLKAAERELYRLGISLYATTKRSIIKAMVYRAIALRRALEQEGIKVIEVYPYAAKARLFGKPIPKKTAPEGRRWLRERLGPLVRGLAEQSPLGHDQLDAIVAAFTAWLHADGRTEAVGDHDEGVIVIPLG